MKMVEVKLRSATRELEKLSARKERAEKALKKATDKANKLGCNWTKEEHAEWMKTVETTPDGNWIANDSDIKINGVYFDVVRAKRDLEEVNEAIKNAEKRLEASQKAVDEYLEELNRISDIKQKEELLKLEFEQERKEWAKDGITLKGRYYGITPNGCNFIAERNNGFTERSLHCYSLWIDGNTIFTSGEFWRVYATIKKW